MDELFGTANARELSRIGINWGIRVYSREFAVPPNNLFYETFGITLRRYDEFAVF